MSAGITGGLAFISGVFALINGGLAIYNHREQKRMQIERLKGDIDRNSLAWGQQAIDVLAEAQALVRAHGADPQSEPFRTKRAELAWRLSSLADQGRMFFPNFDPEAKGLDKDPAFRGQRAPILYALIYAHYEMEAVQHATGRDPADCAAFLYQCRRHLVSELQVRLDPRRKNELVDRWDHLGTKQRDDAIRSAGRLGVRLEARRRGLLQLHQDGGLVHRITRDERLQIVREVDPGSAQDVEVA